jgi:hypothetical protein
LPGRLFGFSCRRFSECADVAAVFVIDDWWRRRGMPWLRQRLQLIETGSLFRRSRGGRRAAALSLLMVAAAIFALVAGWAMGTFLQSVVFDLEDQESLHNAGPWGYVAGFFLIALMALPALVGTVLGVRARRLGESRLGTTGIVVNALIAAYLVIPGVATLVFG